MPAPASARCGSRSPRTSSSAPAGRFEKMFWRSPVHHVVGDGVAVVDVEAVGPHPDRPARRPVRRQLAAVALKGTAPLRCS